MAGDYRIPLSRDRLLAAAVAYADQHGIDALSMRRLAAELGFEAMALYNHVANKDDLVDGMLDLVAAEIEPASPHGDWKSAIRANAISHHEMLMRHRWAAGLWALRTLGPQRMRLMESQLAAIGRAGFSRDLAHRAFHAVSNHILGYTLQEVSFQFEDGEAEEAASAFVARIPEGSFPLIVEHVRQHLEESAPRDEFAFELDLILDGLERIHAEESAG